MQQYRSSQYTELENLFYFFSKSQNKLYSSEWYFEDYYLNLF